jgi:hypothetical protein
VHHSERGGEAICKPFFAICFAAAPVQQIVMCPLDRAAVLNCPVSLPECSRHAQSSSNCAYRNTDVPFAVRATIHARLKLRNLLQTFDLAKPI